MYIRQITHSITSSVQAPLSCNYLKAKFVFKLSSIYQDSCQYLFNVSYLLKIGAYLVKWLEILIIITETLISVLT
jgi:hypothetical protein